MNTLFKDYSFRTVFMLNNDSKKEIVNFLLKHLLHLINIGLR